MHMRGWRRIATAGLIAGLAAGCGDGSPGADGLRDAFADQIAAISQVTDFHRDGDELTFTGPNGAGGQAEWVVNINSAVVEPYDDESMPFRGIVQSSWYADDELIEPVGTRSGLPSDFLDSGIAQDCWGLWDASEERWTW